MKIILSLVLVLLLSGCLSTQSYIDPALPMVRSEDIQPVPTPRPVQLLFEFRTKGAPNAAATSYAKPIVTETVAKTGLFSTVSETPVAGAPLLTIVIDNVPLTEDAAAKGFGVGLTFGLAGTMVSDGYVCTATYAKPGSASNSKSIKHAMHSTIGNASGPPGLQGMKTTEAMPILIRQMTLNALQAIRRDGL